MPLALGLCREPWLLLLKDQTSAWLSGSSHVTQPLRAAIPLRAGSVVRPEIGVDWRFPVEGFQLLNLSQEEPKRAAVQG